MPWNLILLSTTFCNNSIQQLITVLSLSNSGECQFTSVGLWGFESIVRWALMHMKDLRDN